MSLFVCVCVCVRERERERERFVNKTSRQKIVLLMTSEEGNKKIKVAAKGGFCQCSDGLVDVMNKEAVVSI